MIKKTHNFVSGMLLAFAVCSLFVQPAQAQLRAGGSYLEVIPGAEQQGIASTLAGTLDHFYAFYTNPGATGLMREWQLSASYTNWIPDIYQASLVYGRGLRLPWNKRTRFALALSYLGIKEFDSSNGRAPLVSGGDFLASASLGQPLRFISDYLSLGGSMKYYHSQLDNFNAHSTIFDIGLLFRTKRFRLQQPGGLFEEAIFSAGVSLTQMGKALQFITEETPLPKTLRAGLGLHLGKHDGFQTHLSAEYRKLRDEDGYWGVGAEFSYAYFATIRFGYSFEQDNVLRHLAAGASFRFDDIRSLFFNPGRSKAVRLNTVKSQQNDFFSSPYSGTVNYYTIGPEYFDFISPAHGTIVNADTVQLRWEVSRDPDLWDDTHYWLAVHLDSLELAQTIAAIEQQPRESVLVPMQQNGFFFSDSVNTNELTLDQLSRAIYAQNLQDLPERIDFYWTVVALDKDNHPRFIREKGEHIAKFSLLLPDLRIDITRTWQDSTNATLNTGYAEVTVTNDGANLASNFDIALYDHPKDYVSLQQDARSIIDSLTQKTPVARISTLFPQQDTTFVVQFALQEQDPSQHYLTAHVDDAYAIFESRESNNTARALLQLKYDLALRKMASIDTLFQNEPVNYTLQLTNNGPIAAKAFAITDILPSEVNASDFSHAPSQRGDTLIWTQSDLMLETLPANQSVEIKYVLNLKPPVALEPITLDGIHFIVNTAVFIDSLAAAAVIEKAIPAIRAALERDPDAYIEVSGHTDPSGGDRINIPLSQSRAERVKRYLVERDPLFGLLVARGYASEKPRFPNTTAALRKKNRRVEISLPPYQPIRPSELINSSQVTSKDDVNPANNFAADTVIVFTPPEPAITFEELKFEFEFDDDRLEPADVRKLDYAAGALAKMMDADPALVIEISGHTDIVGDSLYNEGLSVRRAKTVYRYLKEKWRHSKDRIDRLKVAGYGFRQPVASNETVEGRCHNRRIEFRQKGQRIIIQRPISPIKESTDTASLQE